MSAVIKKTFHQNLRNFCVDQNFVRKLNTMGSKIKAKKTIADVKKLKNYLEESNADGSLKGKINRSARLDNKFNDWIKDYQLKNKKYLEILDLTRFADPEVSLKKDASLRKDEVEMLHEFQKRKFDKMAKEENEDRKDSFITSPNKIPEDLSNSVFWQRDQFLTLILARASTTQVTTLSRINHVKYLLFTGNLEGVIGYGIGKGLDWEIAMEKAVNNLKKNLITIDIDYHYSWTDHQDVKFGRQFLTISPNKEYKAWGDPVMGTMLHLAGIHHCRFHDFARNRNPWTRMYAFMKAVTQNRTPKIIAETEGKKLYEIGMSTRRDKFRHSDFFMR